MSEPRFTVNSLQNIETWQWPKEARKTILDALHDPTTKAAERLTAAELAGEVAVMNDQVAEALISVVGDAAALDELRAKAALSFGPILEECDMDGFDDIPFIDDEPKISEETFDKIQELLHRTYSDCSVPKEVRRRVLEASVRAPQDWHRDAIKQAYAGSDREWMLTAVFGMRYIEGFNGPILEALKSKDEEIHYEAVQAAGERELDAAWPHVKALVRDPKTDKDLLLVAIEAVSTIRPAEAREVLEDLTDSEDEEIAAAAEDAIGMAEALTSGEDEAF
jgi:hypothetical protein